MEEEWDWLNIETWPMDYTEFQLPELPDITDPVDNDDGDYILVSSFWSQYCGSRLKFVYDTDFGPGEITGLYVNTIGPVGPPENPGDGDGDGDVDFDDFVLFGDAYGSVEGDPEYNAVMDFDGDGDVDFDDFVAFGDAYGTTY